MEYQDYYAVLGVPRTASQAEIKKAFRKLARQHHPDAKPGDTAAERQFKEVNEANAVLSDPDKRKQYDASARTGRPYPSRRRRPGRRRPRAGARSAGGPFAGMRHRWAGGGNVRYEFRTAGDAGRVLATSSGCSSAGRGRAATTDRPRPRRDGRDQLRGHPGRDGHRDGAGRAGPARAGRRSAAARPPQRADAAPHEADRRDHPRRGLPRARPASSRSTASGSRSRSRPAPTPAPASG